MSATDILGVRYAGGEYVQAVNLTSGETVGLDILATAQRTVAALNPGIWHVANAAALHIEFGDNTIVATTTHTMLMAGERLIVIPDTGTYVSVIKVAGQPDSILRMTRAT